MKIYISGPITGKPNFNREAFTQAAEAIRAAGHEPVNPHELNAHLGDDQPWEEYLKRDIAALVNCDAIFMLYGWHESRGARLENKIARKLKIEGVSAKWVGMPPRWQVVPQPDKAVPGWTRPPNTVLFRGAASDICVAASWHEANARA